MSGFDLQKAQRKERTGMNTLRLSAKSWCACQPTGAGKNLPMRPEHHPVTNFQIAACVPPDSEPRRRAGIRPAGQLDGENHSTRKT